MMVLFTAYLKAGGLPFVEVSEMRDWRILFWRGSKVSVMEHVNEQRRIPRLKAAYYDCLIPF